MAIKIIGVTGLGAAELLPAAGAPDGKPFEEAVAKTQATPGPWAVEGADAVSRPPELAGPPAAPAALSRLDQLFGGIENDKGSVVVIDQRAVTGTESGAAASAEPLADAAPVILAGLTMAAKSAGAGKVLLISGPADGLQDEGEKKPRAVATLDLKTTSGEETQAGGAGARTDVGRPDDSAVASELLREIIEMNDTEGALIVFSSDDADALLEILQNSAARDLDPQFPRTVRVVVADLKSDNSDTISIIVIESGEAFRYNLYNFLSAAFGLMEDKTLPPGKDFLTANILALQGFEVDETAAINPSNTYLAGVLTANAATYIGSVIPPDISDALREAGASPDFIDGYMAERQRVLDWATALADWVASNSPLAPSTLEASGEALEGEDGILRDAVTTSQPARVRPTLAELADDPAFRRLLDTYYVGYQGMIGLFIYNMLVAGLNPRGRV